MKKNINKSLIILYLALFPFGQLPNLLLSLQQNRAMSFQPTDIILGLLLILNIKNVLGIQFVWVTAFSLFFSLIFFDIRELTIGFLYFVRLVSYINLGILVFTLFKTEKETVLLQKALLVIICIISIFGWIQYLFMPDLRTLSILGWDDHYFRLASTFLDPAFTGILLVLGLLLSFFFYKTTNHKVFILLTVFLLVTLGFTYSRASYISAVFGIGILIYNWLPKKFIIVGLLLLAFSITQLPRPAGGEGVKLERLFSLDLKIKNSIQGIAYFSESPLFGYGYNNTCALQKTQGSSSFIKSNSCSGFDNSIIFLLVTIGGVGVAILLLTYKKLLFSVSDKYKSLVFSLTLAVFVHGMFTNTFVYPWVLGFMAIVFGSTIRRSTVKEYK